jgi:hypothetical protein
MRFVHAYALLLVMAVGSAASTGWLLIGTRGHDRGACHQWISGPTRVVACAAGYSYDQSGHDLGGNTPVPQLPRR